MRKQTRAAVLVLSVMSATLALAACCGAPAVPVSLNRTYTLVDEEGRKAGTVVFTPLGGGEIRDSDGTVIGVVSAPAGRAAAPARDAEKK